MIRFKFLSKSKIGDLPKTAGVYCFARRSFSEDGLLYIGKAANVKERVKNHFLQSTYRDNLFIGQVAKIGFIKTDSEIEALLLESRLIKKYQPKYNVMWKDDKNYFYVAITKEGLPRVLITHQPNNVSSIKYQAFSIRNTKYKIQNTKYSCIGPFVDGGALKQTLKFLRKIFPYYTATKHPKKPCPWCHLKFCPGPNPNREEYRKNIKNLTAVLEGRRQSILKKLKKEMALAAKTRDFEKAAEARDQISALENVFSHSKILGRETVPQTSSWYRLKIAQKLKEILNAERKIYRIESYDVSNIQGKQAAGSMITFVNGRPDKNFYRKFKIRITGKPNDVAMIKETLSRRLNHPEWPYPDLMIIDGGKAQLNAAIAIIKYKIQDTKYKIRTMALAKKHNELFIEGRKKPILLNSLPGEVSNLVLHLRDEAHRFARKYHLLLRKVDLFSGF